MTQRGAGVRRWQLALAVTAVTLLTAMAAPPARAGEYPVYACEPSFGDVNHAWTGHANSPRMSVYSNCPVPWSEMRDWNRGLVTLHPTSGALGDDSVGAFEYAALELRAPAGAGLSRMTYEHTFCGAATFQGGLLNDAGQWLHASAPGSCGTLVPSPYTVGLNGTPSIRLMTVCARSRCNVEGNERAWATMRSATVWVADSTAPEVAILGGSLVDGRWHRGTQSVDVNAWDNVGIRHADVYLDGKRALAVEGTCDWTYVIPCGASLGTLTVESPIVADGAHRLAVNAVDSAGNWGTTSATTLIDNTAPTGPGDLQVAGGEGWRATDVFSVSWSNPAQPATAPIAGVDWAICPATAPPDAATGCSFGSRGGDGLRLLPGLRVPRAGDWVAHVWLHDAAGNSDRRSARTVHLRYDATSPDIAILGSDPADPQRIAVTASDALSGLASVEIEVRREGDTAWVSLPVAPTAGQFVAHLDDSKLPRGHYLLRARAVDMAGNERSTDMRGASVAALDLPVRLTTRFTLGGLRTVRGRHGRTRVALRRTPTAAFGEPVAMRGRLTLPGDNALGDAEVQVFEQTALPGEPWRRVGLVRTDSRGRLSYKALPGPSRVLRFEYGGTPLIQPHSKEVRLRVRAKTSFEVNRGRVVNGDEVRFHGRVRGRLPRGGKLLQLQAYSRGTWRTFANPRASQRTHRWRYRYRFSATRGRVRYRFRAVVPPEAGFPYVRGSSRLLSVTVRGL
jgi:hypothetical protein